MAGWHEKSVRWVVALFLLLWPGLAAADTWMPATRHSWFSPDHHMRFTVEPRAISGPLQYFSDKVKDRNPAGQQPGGPDKAQGTLEREENGHWVTLWHKPLVNDVSPVSAIVANDGAHVVTFDNWHAMGWGDDAVAIYGPDGTLIRAMGLTAFLPDDYQEALPRSVSSIQWGGEHHFSAAGDRLILEVVVPTEAEPGAAQHYTPIEVELAGGGVIPPSGAGWDQALAEARKVAAADRAYAEAQRRARIAPLLGPTTTGDLEWHDYLVEAFMRLDPDWMEDFPANTVLRDPKAKDYKPSEGWVRDALLQKDLPATAIAIASPASPDNLVRVITEAARKVKPGALKGARIYVAVTDAYRGPIAAALAPTGATFIQLDPTRPIPQRKERIPGSVEEKQAREAWEKRIDEMADDSAKSES
jgi:hypothetical protein